MSQSPYRAASGEPSKPVERVEHPAGKAASVAVVAVLIAWFALGDRLRGGSELIIGVFATGCALLAAWRAGRGAR